MKKIIITGTNGQVGWELQRTLCTQGKIFSFDRERLNLTNPSHIKNLIRDIRPDIIVNGAAYTAVDKAESEKELCVDINANAPALMAEEAKKLGAIFVHYSTDYVFDGSSKTPYLETDPTNPLNVYGKSKVAGETAIQSIGGKSLIFRTSWVYGNRGKNFLLTMLKLAREKDSLNIVNDQIGAPTWCRFIAEATAQILASDLKSNPWGIYNLTSSGKTSWLQFAETIFQIKSQQTSPDQSFKAPHLTGISSSEYPTPALRPKNSLLSHEKIQKTFGLYIPLWDEILRLCMEN